MAFVLKDRVQETTTTTGTGAVTLAGAVTGYQSFSAVCSIGDTVWYAINHSATAWETGIGTYSSANTLTRTTVFESSNAGSAVNFGTGTKLVFIGIPASRATYLNGAPTTWRGLLPRGYHSGGILSNGTDATNDINISEGAWRDSTDTVDIDIVAMTGKQLDANWAPGSAAGMRNSAAGIANGTYHIYAVRTLASETADIYAYAGVAGTDADSAAFISTMLTALQAEPGGASYVYARRIGSIIRETGSIVQFTQKSKSFNRAVVANNSSGSNPGISAVSITLSIPTGIIVDADISCGMTQATTSRWFAAFTALDTTDTAASIANADVAGINSSSTGESITSKQVRTNTSGQIRARASFSDANSNFLVFTRGWVDTFGVDA